MNDDTFEYKRCKTESIFKQQIFSAGILTLQTDCHIHACIHKCLHSQFQSLIHAGAMKLRPKETENQHKAASSVATLCLFVIVRCHLGCFVSLHCCFSFLCGHFASFLLLLCLTVIILVLFVLILCLFGVIWYHFGSFVSVSDHFASLLLFGFCLVSYFSGFVSLCSPLGSFCRHFMSLCGVFLLCILSAPWGPFSW